MAAPAAGTVATSPWQATPAQSGHVLDTAWPREDLLAERLATVPGTCRRSTHVTMVWRIHCVLTCTAQVADRNPARGHIATVTNGDGGLPASNASKAPPCRL